MAERKGRPLPLGHIATMEALDGVADDWPFTYEDLEPFYDEMDLEMGTSGLNGDPENGYDYTKVGGVAINMTMKIKNPPPQLAQIFETKYSDLSLSQASLWDEFVAWTDKAWQAK